MVTYYVKKDEVYKVSATVNCAVYDANSNVFASCDAGSIVTFKAPTSKISLSDNNAALTCISETPGDLSGLTEHVNNSGIHVSAKDKQTWNETAQNLPDITEHINDSGIHVTEDQKAALDDPTLNERVLNISTLFPGAGGGEKYDMFTFQQALSFANQYITIRGLSSKVTGGLKVKFKTLEGYYMEYMWNGEGSITDQTKWTSAGISKEEFDAWKNSLEGYAKNKFDVPNAVVITDSFGNLVSSPIISVAELNTLNDNLESLKYALEEIRNRLTALES